MDNNFVYCTDCKRLIEVVLDHASGDTICTECGLVLEHHFIDETCEWRTFADTEKDGNDPNRVGAASNPLLTHTHLSTTIIKSTSAAKSDDSSQQILASSKAHDVIMDPNRVLQRGFESMAAMADRLGIARSTKIRADEIYKNVVEKKALKEKSLNSILAACLFISCKESKLPRTIKEICSAAERVSRKEIHRAVEFIKKNIEVEGNATAGLIDASGLVRRFCSVLGMNNQAMKAVQEAIDNSQEFDIRRTPSSLLAAIIFMINQLSDQKFALRDIAMATQVTEKTIKKSYKDIYPYASKVVPYWYAKEEDLKKLCHP